VPVYAPFMSVVFNDEFLKLGSLRIGGKQFGVFLSILPISTGSFPSSIRQL